MNNQEVRIISLPPMRVASFHAYSSTPEIDAWKKTYAWAKAHDCLQEAPATRIFGFNNPDPAAGSPNYGYEFWVTVGTQVLPDGEVKIKDFPGGMYAVLRCDVYGDPGEIIPRTWQKLVKWFETSHHIHGTHQWLEEHLLRGESNQGGFVLDLYLPITE
jgi:DNA gyrase inhibitor GyrI